MNKKIVIIGFESLGFTLLKRLLEINQNFDIVVISNSIDDKRKNYFQVNYSKSNLKFIEADLSSSVEIEEVCTKNLKDNFDLIISTNAATNQVISHHKEHSTPILDEFFSYIIPIKFLSKKILSNQNGRIIAVNSIRGVSVSDDKKQNKHSAKWAFESFLGSLQQELFEQKIHVDVIRIPDNLNPDNSIQENSNNGLITLASKKIIKHINWSIDNEGRSGKKVFIPKYLYFFKLKERIFPFLSLFRKSKKPFGTRIGNHRYPTYNRILITGGSSGLGRDLALLYSKNAKEIIITGRNKKRLEEVKTRIEENSNCNIITKRIDFESIEQVTKLSKEIYGIELIINNSGQYISKFIRESTENDYSRILISNFVSSFILTEALLEKNPVHKILNILSTAAIAGRQRNSIYSSSKSALWAYSRELRRRYGNTIQILEVIPSTFKSNLFRKDNGTLNEAHSNSGNLNSMDVAKKIHYAEKSGSNILYIPFKARLFTYLECLYYPLFRKLFR